MTQQTPETDESLRPFFDALYEHQMTSTLRDSCTCGAGDMDTLVDTGVAIQRHRRHLALVLRNAASDAMTQMLADAERQGAERAKMRIADLHRRGSIRPDAIVVDGDVIGLASHGCQTCLTPWPCPTVAELREVLPAEVNDGRGANSIPPHGADDAPDESKGAASKNAPASAGAILLQFAKPREGRS